MFIVCTMSTKRQDETGNVLEVHHVQHGPGLISDV